MNGVFDTSVYQLLPDNKTLQILPIKNGIKSNDTLNYQIAILDSTQFVLVYNGGIYYGVDSLQR